MNLLYFVNSHLKLLMYLVVLLFNSDYFFLLSRKTFDTIKESRRHCLLVFDPSTFVLFQESQILWSLDFDSTVVSTKKDLRDPSQTRWERGSKTPDTYYGPHVTECRVVR